MPPKRTYKRADFDDDFFLLPHRRQLREPEDEDDQNRPAMLARPAAYQRPAVERGGYFYSTNWMFTAWNQPHWLNAFPRDARGRVTQWPPEVQYIAFQQEIAPSHPLLADPNAPSPDLHQRGLHWQGYVVMRHRISKHAVCQILHLDPLNTWLEPRWGTHDQAAKYVTKEETRVAGTMQEWGESPKENAVSNFQAAASFAATGAPFTEVIKRFPAEAARYANGLQKLCLAAQPKPEWRKYKIKVYWGTTKTGKTRLVHDEARQLGISLYDKISGTDFWEGYENQEGILLDEFEGERNNQMKLSFFLKLTNGYPPLLNTKGSSRWAVFTHIWITSNVDPKDWYPAHKYPPDQIRAFWERFEPIEKNILHFTEPIYPKEETVEEEEEEEDEEKEGD